MVALFPLVIALSVVACAASAVDRPAATIASQAAVAVPAEVTVLGAAVQYDADGSAYAALLLEPPPPGAFVETVTSDYLLHPSGVSFTLGPIQDYSFGNSVGDFLAVGFTAAGRIAVVDGEGATTELPADSVIALAPTGRDYAYVAPANRPDDSHVVIWNGTTVDSVQPVSTTVISPDGTRLAVGFFTWDGASHTFEVRTYRIDVETGPIADRSFLLPRARMMHDIAVRFDQENALYLEYRGRTIDREEIHVIRDERSLGSDEHGSVAAVDDLSWLQTQSLLYHYEHEGVRELWLSGERVRRSSRIVDYHVDLSTGTLVYVHASQPRERRGRSSGFAANQVHEFELSFRGKEHTWVAIELELTRTSLSDFARAGVWSDLELSKRTLERAGLRYAVGFLRDGTPLISSALPGEREETELFVGDRRIRDPRTPREFRLFSNQNDLPTDTYVLRDAQGIAFLAIDHRIVDAEFDHVWAAGAAPDGAIDVVAERAGSFYLVRVIPAESLEEG